MGTSRSLLVFYLGSGLLLTCLLGLLNLGEAATAAPGKVLAGTFCGIGLAGCATALLSRGLGRASARTLRAVAAGCAVLGAAPLIAPGFLAAHSLTGALLAGAGCTGLGILWVSAYARLAFVDALQKGAWSLAAGIAAYAAASALPAAAFAPALGTACLLSALAVVPLLDGRLSQDAPDGAHGSLALRLANLLKTCWVPCAGLAICVFLVGVLCTQEAPALLATHPAPRWSAAVGPFATAAGLALACRRLQGYEDARRLFWVVIPVVAALFLITPNFDGVDEPWWHVLVENLQNSGSSLLALISWSLLLMAARTNDFLVGAVFGAAAACLAGAGLAGIAVHAFWDAVGNVAAVVLWVVYVCATVGVLAVSGAGERAVREQERGVLDAYLLPRCARLAAARQLTPREAEILELLGRGHSYAFIAENAYISEATVRTHARNIYRKLGVVDQEGLINLIDAQ